MRLSHLLLLGAVALAPGTALAVPAYTVTDLGTLGGPISLGTGVGLFAPQVMVPRFSTGTIVFRCDALSASELVYVYHGARLPCLLQPLQMVAQVPRAQRRLE